MDEAEAALKDVVTSGEEVRLLVLDLDYTIWDTFCFEKTQGPYERSGEASVCYRCRDSGENKELSLFPDVMPILRWWRSDPSGRRCLAIASKTPKKEAAAGILGALGLWTNFASRQAYTGSKQAHFEAIRSQTHIPYSQMMFFDDNATNCREVGALGVNSIKVEPEQGLTWSKVTEALRAFKTRKSSQRCLSAFLRRSIPADVRPSHPTFSSSSSSASASKLQALPSTSSGSASQGRKRQHHSKPVTHSNGKRAGDLSRWITQKTQNSQPATGSANRTDADANRHARKIARRSLTEGTGEKQHASAAQSE